MMPLETINEPGHDEKKTAPAKLGEAFPWPDAIPCHIWRWQQRWTRGRLWRCDETKGDETGGTSATTERPGRESAPASAPLAALSDELAGWRSNKW